MGIEARFKYAASKCEHFKRKMKHATITQSLLMTHIDLQKQDNFFCSHIIGCHVIQQV